MSRLFADEPPNGQQIINELVTELAYRRTVYPRLIRDGKLKPERAAHRTRCVEDAVALLRQIGAQSLDAELTRLRAGAPVPPEGAV